MLIQIISMLLGVAVGLVAGACLLRLYMQWTSTPFYNPIGQFVLALSNWLVLPIRRVVPSLRRLDTASLLAALLLKLAQNLILATLGGLAGASTPLLATVVISVFDVVFLALSLATAVLLAAAIVSWLRVDPAISYVLARLAAPVLAPLRRWIPALGGLDLSPLVAIVGLQVLSIVLRALQNETLMALVIG